MAKNLLHCETGFGVYRSTQLGHIPFFLLLYLLVGPSIIKQGFADLLDPSNDPEFFWQVIWGPPRIKS
jgi:hypothetical protein